MTAEPPVRVLDDALVHWLSGRHQAVLVTLRADGSPQSSNVAVVFRGSTGYVSVTETRAKTRNLRRDPRAVSLGGAVRIIDHVTPAGASPAAGRYR